MVSMSETVSKDVVSIGAACSMSGIPLDGAFEKVSLVSLVEKVLFHWLGGYSRVERPTFCTALLREMEQAALLTQLYSVF